jgi:PAS domain S-box-containing protein
MRSESADLARLAAFVGRLFQVPVAYAAMLGHRDRVMCRIGSGSTHWKDFKTLPVGPYLESPMVIQELPAGLPEGADLGDLRFAATAPIDTLCGQHLGVLVIADPVARPEFSELDLETLVELAAVIADRIEMRMIATQAMDSKMRYGEAEQRFRAMANGAQTLIACDEADGSSEFVNDSWLRFSGRHRENELGDGWQQLMHPQHRARVLDVYVQALQARQPFTVEVPLRRHDGVFRWMRGNGTPRFLQDGTFAGFTLCLTDISDYSEAAGGSAVEGCAVEAGVLP